MYNGMLKMQDVPKNPPKSDYSIIKDVINRQIGFNNSMPHRFQGSVLAVQSINLSHQLELECDCCFASALEFNEKGNLLASASRADTITIWDWAWEKEYATLHTGHRRLISDLKWLPFSPLLVSSALDASVRLLDMETNTNSQIAKHKRPCRVKISTHVDSPYIVLSAGQDSRVLSIDIREEKAKKLLEVKSNGRKVSLNAIHSNPSNNNEFCVGGLSEYVYIYDRRKPTDPVQLLYPMHSSTILDSSVYNAFYNHNGTEVIASYLEADTYLFNVSSSYKGGDFTYRYQMHTLSVNFFGPNSEYILSTPNCGNIAIWNKKTEAIVQWIIINEDRGIVNAVEPHPNMLLVATGRYERNIKIWAPIHGKNHYEESIQNDYSENGENDRKDCRSVLFYPNDISSDSDSLSE